MTVLEYIENMAKWYSQGNATEHTFRRDLQHLSHLNPEIVNQIANRLGLKFTPEKEEEEERASPVCYAQSPELREGFEIEIPPNTFSPIDVLDYIYAVMHSSPYRGNDKKLFELGFSKIFFPKNKNIFWQLVKLGGQVRRIHLLKSAKANRHIATYPKDGENTITRSIEKKDWELYDKDNQIGRIWINDRQYFDKVPLLAWGFYIGDDRPAQKWLKDRKGQELNLNDILLYQKIIVALIETDKLMKAIDQLVIQ